MAITCRYLARYHRTFPGYLYLLYSERAVRSFGRLCALLYLTEHSICTGIRYRACYMARCEADEEIFSL